MWNSFEVLFKQRLKLLLQALKLLPTWLRYLFILICVSNVADNPVTGWFLWFADFPFTVPPRAIDFLPAASAWESHFFVIPLDFKCWRVLLSACQLFLEGHFSGEPSVPQFNIIQRESSSFVNWYTRRGVWHSLKTSVVIRHLWFVFAVWVPTECSQQQHAT